MVTIILVLQGCVTLSVCRNCSTWLTVVSAHSDWIYLVTTKVRQGEKGEKKRKGNVESGWASCILLTIDISKSWAVPMISSNGPFFGDACQYTVSLFPQALERKRNRQEETCHFLLILWVSSSSLFSSWLSLPGFMNMVVMSAMCVKLLWNMGACGPQTEAGYLLQKGKEGLHEHLFASWF